jgi:hypothetical protein
MLEPGQTSMKVTHERLFERGIYTKSMVNTKCGIQTGLRYGMITGRYEKETPGYVMQLGITMDDLLSLWGRHLLGGLSVPTMAQARQFLSEQWDKRMKSLDNDPPDDKDLKIVKLLKLYGGWMAVYEERKARHGVLVAVQQQRGYHGDTQFAGVKIAGHIDYELQEAVEDWKLGGYRSWYRTSNVEPFPYELAHYSALTGKKKTAYVCMVHDLKTKSPIEVTERVQTPETLDMAAERLLRFDAQVRAGDPYVLQPPPKVGQFPCGPKWCGYFGRQCPLTKNLKREDY